MNRNRRSLPKQMRKAMEKNIKEGQDELSEERLLRTDELTPKKALKRYPQKRQKVEKPLMDATVKRMEIKKTKKTTKQSKRTSTEEVDHHESPPAYEHREGERWEKTLVQQNQMKRKILTNKMQKRRGKRKAS